VCFEAGPTGYGLRRQVRDLGHDCMVVAPVLIPKRSGERVKTNRRDAVTLARLHPAGELTRVWVPDVVHEAVRDLVRARESAADDLRRTPAATFLSSCATGGSMRLAVTGHWRWLARQSFEHAAQRSCSRRRSTRSRMRLSGYARLDEQLRDRADLVHGAGRRGLSGDARCLVPGRCDLRGQDRGCAPLRYAAAVDGLSRPGSGERSTGDTVRRSSLTLAGNRRACRALVEAGLDLPLPPRVSEALRVRLEGLPKAVRDIAWKVQVRLCARYRRLSAAGKKPHHMTRRSPRIE